MSYPDEPEDEYRTAEGRSGEGGRRRGAQPARPAWDALTYGRPDDTRRRRAPSYPPPPPPERGYPPPDRGYPPPPPERPYQYEERHQYEERPSYRTDTYPGGEPYRGDQYPAAPAYPDEPTYDASPYQERPYEYEQRPYDERPYDNPAPAFPESAFPGATRAASEYPGGVEANVAEPPRSRAGRNLPAAIGVGVGLGIVVLGSLFLWRPAFLGVIALAVGVGVWELVRAIRTSGVNPPLIPLIAGGGLMTGLAWWGQADALTFGLMVTVLAAMVWRLADGAGGYGRDVAAATVVAVYVPFLGGFAALLASSPDGDLRVLFMLVAVVLSDTGGYAAGVFLGRHPMAPSVSPKKSWEGLAGSLVATAIGCAILGLIMFDLAVWWGAVFGLAVSAVAVLGDLGESMIKRDLGVKDMSTLLPGHGGLMDRLDSVVFAAPTAYLLLLVLAPSA
jgi:phosphatidate cytidylyltransferase